MLLTIEGIQHFGYRPGFFHYDVLVHVLGLRLFRVLGEHTLAFPFLFLGVLFGHGVHCGLHSSLCKVHAYDTLNVYSTYID